jgi:predicted nicotinamide N-methyase
MSDATSNLITRNTISASDAKVDHARQRLLARIAKQFDTNSREIRIGELRIPFTQIKDPDRVLDDICAEADRREKIDGHPLRDEEMHLPYWAELWDSALGVGQWLCDQTSNQRRCVLDLGCGMGLAGTVAAALGHRVLLADIEADALLFARANAMQFDPHVRARRVDWRHDRVDEHFDLIIGADVLYDKSQWDYLEPFFAAHLAPGGSVILGEPGRQSGEVFVTWISAKDWKLEQSEQRVLTRERPIKLFRLFR